MYYRIHVCGSFPGESWRDEPGDKSSGGNTWRIIPFSKWLITMVIVRPLTGVNHFPSKWPWTWLVNRGDPNYLRYLGGIILQVTLRYLMVRNSTFNRQVAEVSYRSPGSPSCLPFRMGRFRALGRNLDSKTDMGGEPPAVSGVRGGGKRWIFFFWGGKLAFSIGATFFGGVLFLNRLVESGLNRLFFGNEDSEDLNCSISEPPHRIFRRTGQETENRHGPRI